MNLRSGRNQVRAEANMASISDLVFLLLIFFILLSTMIKPGIPVDPPSANGSNFDNKAITTVTINKDHEFFLNNDKTPIKKELVESKLRIALESMPKEKRAIVLNVDKEAESEYLVYILDIANMNRWKVGIATKNN
jgi:biopolymer transport protein ExbD